MYVFFVEDLQEVDDLIFRTRQRCQRGKNGGGERSQFAETVDERFNVRREENLSILLARLIVQFQVQRIDIAYRTLHVQLIVHVGLEAEDVVQRGVETHRYGEHLPKGEVARGIRVLLQCPSLKEILVRAEFVLNALIDLHELLIAVLRIVVHQLIVLSNRQHESVVVDVNQIDRRSVVFDQSHGGQIRAQVRQEDLHVPFQQLLLFPHAEIVEHFEKLQRVLFAFPLDVLLVARECPVVVRQKVVHDLAVVRANGQSMEEAFVLEDTFDRGKELVHAEVEVRFGRVPQFSRHVDVVGDLGMEREQMEVLRLTEVGSTWFALVQTMFDLSDPFTDQKDKGSGHV